MDTKYLAMLAEQFDTKEKILTEIINLEAILNLPKGTEHFVSDLHGEYDAFDHVLRNGSGNVKRKIQDLFLNQLSQEELQNLITLIYYPEEQVLVQESQFQTPYDREQWYTKTIGLLVEATKECASKYSRSKVRKSFPPKFSYIMEELLYNFHASKDKQDYYDAIIGKLIELRQADDLVIAFCYAIQRFVVDHLHVVGDIYDRGPAPDQIMERLIAHHSVDIQWGNHDMLWMGAMCGNAVCMANLIRICARYDNLDILEDCYGINLRPLTSLAEKYYEDNLAFRSIQMEGREATTQEEQLQATKIHQAISIIQFKLEKQIIIRRPEFKMEHRLLLDAVDFDALTIRIGEHTYPLMNTCFSLVSPECPTVLTEEEEKVVQKLLLAFQSSEKLERHIDFLFQKGSLYLVYNQNLLFHGCIPLNQDGSFQSMMFQGKEYAGRALLDFFECHVRRSYANPGLQDDFSTDLMWYLWSGEMSSLFGKKDMTTFERYFIADKGAHQELQNPYYALREQEEVCNRILEEFGIDPTEGHIINGHTPVREIRGENPIKSNGKMIVIDGGYSRAYQKKTGIGGYTLLYNSYGMILAIHEPFAGREHAIATGSDIISTRRVVDQEKKRKKIRETNIGKMIIEKSQDLQELFYYQYQGRYSSK